MIYIEENKIQDMYLGETKISKAYLGTDLVYLKEEESGEVGYESQYLTITSLEDSNKIRVKGNSTSLNIPTIECSINGGLSWQSFTITTTGTALATLNNDESVLLRATCSNTTNSNGYITFNTTKKVDISGNIMSLVYGKKFKRKTDLSGKPYIFKNLFESATKIINAQNLILPATVLPNDCYNSMFRSCSGLLTVPEIPDVPMSTRCCWYMFSECSSLITALEKLPSITAESCFYSMFSSCTSLQTAPKLPATTLAIGCYSNMFSNCSSLTSAPELPATNLAAACYSYMFNRCSNLNYIKAMFTMAPSNSFTQYWVRNVATEGTFVKNSNATWTNAFSTSAIPEGWTVETASE